MSHNADEVNTCPTLGHLYTSATLLRCPHREGYFVTVRAWYDSDHDDPIVLWERIEQFGPFDDLEYIRKRVGYLTEEAVRVTQLHPV